MINKSLLINLTSLLLIIFSFFFNFEYSQLLLYTGMFAFSGAITNELAIFMIFNKVPFLYGSGIIEKNFEPFKNSIKEMVMSQFFNKEKLDFFFEKEFRNINFKPIIKNANFEKITEAIFEEILDSKIGSILSFIGGNSALNKIKPSLERKLKKTAYGIVTSKSFKEQVNNYIEKASFSDDLINKVEALVDDRLNELSPLMIKELVEKLIKSHLSWLVVWGGIFGGLIGFITTLGTILI